VRFALVCVRCARSVRLALRGCALCARKVNDWLVIGMECCYFGVFWPQGAYCWGGYGGAGVFRFEAEHTVSSPGGELRGNG